MSNGTITNSNGKCVDIGGDHISNKQLIMLWTCHNSASQQWQTDTDGSVYSPNSGRCLDLPNSNTTDGTQLQIFDCNHTKAQVWLVP